MLKRISIHSIHSLINSNIKQNITYSLIYFILIHHLSNKSNLKSDSFLSDWSVVIESISH